MRETRFTESQIVDALKRAGEGPVSRTGNQLCDILRMAFEVRRC
jgi:hypothetical protein